jgi:hypothetical protein
MTEGIQTLDELLSDPMVRLVMARDGVRPEELRMSLERARDRTEQRLFVPPPHVIARECQAFRLCS